MKLIIKSKQDYTTHIEEYKEEFECTTALDEGRLEINFNDGIIIIEENKLTYKRGENKIIIEPNKTNECDYETENGMFVLDIEGISVENKMQEILTGNIHGTVSKATYKILITGVEPYTNIIEIIIEK